MLLETKVRSLITNGDGAVVGVKADGQERSYVIRAKAVAISAGNIGSNMDMLRRFLPRYFTSDNYFSHYSLNSLTGDGIAMAEEVGAEVGKNMSIAIHALAHYPGTYTVQRLVNEPLGIIVNQNGKRFCCEDEADDAEYITDRQPDGRGYYLLDRPTLEEGFGQVMEHIRFGDRTPTWEEFWGDLDGKPPRASWPSLTRWRAWPPISAAPLRRCRPQWSGATATVTQARTMNSTRRRNTCARLKPAPSMPPACSGISM